jgi:hypothetical protein
VPEGRSAEADYGRTEQRFSIARLSTGAQADHAAVGLTGADVDTGHMRITIRVRPGSAHPGVGGEHDGALVVG